MMTALAQVVSLDKTEKGMIAHLTCEQKTSCNSCKSQKSCGTGLATKALGSKSHQWRLETSEPLKIGDVVEIGLSEKYLVQSALIVYLLPLLFMFIGAMIANLLSASEGVQIISFVASGGLGFILAKQTAKQIEKKTAQDVVMIRSLGELITSH